MTQGLHSVVSTRPEGCKRDDAFRWRSRPGAAVKYRQLKLRRAS
jgi:hypothetical protein